MPELGLTIVGGGIGGLAAALAASRVGVRVLVIEKSQELGEIGAGIQLAPNGLRMLDRLGILGDIRGHAVYPKRVILADAISGQQITSFEFDEQFREQFGYPYAVIHRRDLLSAELEACRRTPLITLLTNKKAVKFDELDDRVRVECADGSVYENDAVIGADGLWSTTRRIVHNDGDPVCEGIVAYRGVVGIGALSSKLDCDSVTLWIGPNLRLMQYAIRNGEMLNQVAIFRSTHYRSDSHNWGMPDELDNHFDKTCDQVRAAVANVDRQRQWRLFDRPSISTWTHNRITLLGDAAHPMLPHGAQGACQALEDAVCLGGSLEKCGLNVVQALRNYQGIRVERTTRVRQMLKYVGEIDQVDRSGHTFHRELLAKHIPNDFEFVRWLYGARCCE